MAVDRLFYTQCAVQHGGMTVYYLQQVAVHLLIPPTFESETTWALEHAVIEAREAWHYALLMSPGQVEAELARQAEDARLDARLEF